MKIILGIIAVVVALVGMWILDEIEGEDAMILGMAFVVLGLFLGVMSLLSMPPV